ncbi:MAG: hypothetical protein IKV64_01685 [Clostridia bacterium]|nr:hypothetical protein [Clostridia bacterium]
MKQRITLYADEGMVLTDGENYGTIVHLEAGLDGEKYYEITKEEYDKIMEEQERLLEEQMFNNIGASEEESV